MIQSLGRLRRHQSTQRHHQHARQSRHQPGKANLHALPVKIQLIMARAIRGCSEELTIGITRIQMLWQSLEERRKACTQILRMEPGIQGVAQKLGTVLDLIANLSHSRRRYSSCQKSYL